MEYSGNRRKVCFIGTYPPRECGIATFNCDLRNSLVTQAPDVRTDVIAISNSPARYNYPSEVVFEIRRDRRGDYHRAAHYINFSGADLVCLQHEFGIFGGAEGRHISALLDDLRKPVVTILHTVLREPTPGYRESFLKVAEASDSLVVMTGTAATTVKQVYGVSDEKISIIHHGVPDVPFIDPNYFKDKFGVEGRLVILTFGLLSRNKGIEMMLEALPAVVKRHPHVVYIVLGATHPEVKRRDGDEYSLRLKRRVRELEIKEHVIFHDRYVDFTELCEFIGASDVYVTPYQSKEQMVSGTLSYAVGMGKAVVSTPYLYAEDLLQDGRGRLVSFDDPAEMSQALIELIENKRLRHRMRKKAYEYGRQMVWSEVGRRYLELFERIGTSFRKRPLSDSPPGTTVVAFDLPEPSLDHLSRLTDDVGIIQHAAYGVPDRRFGYSTDDCARGLVVALTHYREFEDDVALSLASRYMSYLQHAQLPDGRFHNFMSYARIFIDKVGSEDTIGRALWGLGTAVTIGPHEGIRTLAREMFERSLGALDLEHSRAQAYAICGLHAFLQKYNGAVQVRRRLVELADRLVNLYETNSTEDWRWFGEELTYANAKLPQAMILAHQTTGDPVYLKIGIESLDWLLVQTFREDYFDFVGNQGWYRRGEERAIFGQQPIEAGYTAEACALAYEVTGKLEYLSMAEAAVEWLLGRNRLGVRLYDMVSGACSDGVDPNGPSLNQGAESTICSLLGLLAASRIAERKRLTDTEPPAATPLPEKRISAKIAV